MKKCFLILFISFLTNKTGFTQDSKCNDADSAAIKKEISGFKKKISEISKETKADTATKYKILFKEAHNSIQHFPRAKWNSRDCFQKYTDDRVQSLGRIYKHLRSAFYLQRSHIQAASYGKYLVLSYLNIYNGNQTSRVESYTFYYERE